MGQFTAIVAGVDEGKSLFAIRKLSECLVRGDSSIIYFTDSTNVMQRCRSYSGVSQTHHVTVIYISSVENTVRTIDDALNGRDYDCVFVDVGATGEAFINYLHGLSRDYNVYVTIPLGCAVIENDMLGDGVPPNYLVNLASRIILILREDVGVIAEYHFDKDSRSFGFCRYYFIEIAGNGFPRLEVFGEDYDPTEPWRIEESLHNRAQLRNPLR